MSQHHLPPCRDMTDRQTSVGNGSMLRHECPCHDTEPIIEIVLHIFSILAHYACLFFLIFKTKGKKGINVDSSY